MLSDKTASSIRCPVAPEHTCSCHSVDETGPTPAASRTKTTATATTTESAQQPQSAAQPQGQAQPLVQPQQQTNVVIPVPVMNPGETFTYVTVKGSLHDSSCAVFGLNDAEVQALRKRYAHGLTQVINGVMVNSPPLHVINSLAQLHYKVVTSCGEAEICWTMEREI